MRRFTPGALPAAGTSPGAWFPVRNLGAFVPAAATHNAGTGPYRAHVGDGVRELIDGSGVPLGI